MTTFCEPFIEPQNYDAFRSVLNPHLPDTQDEWLELLAEQSFPRVLAGDIVKQVTVKPDEFVRYCRAAGARHDLQGLREFAAAKHAGNNY